MYLAPFDQIKRGTSPMYFEIKALMYLAGNYCYRINAKAPGESAVKASSNSTAKR